MNIFIPRGIRNNNPGNLRLSATRWQGQKPVQTDTDFVEFDTALYGLRALMRTLVTYYLKYRLDTVESVINRWAPPHENATDHYIYHVARRLGVARRERINLLCPDTLQKAARAIVRHENGHPPADTPADWYDISVYRQAAELVIPTPHP